jgi:coenzyme F420-reducing hydrogenase beta subunit
MDLGALRPLFVRSPESRIAMSGLPCHVQAIRKLQQLESPEGDWARLSVVFLIELACSSGTTPDGTRTLIEDVVGIPAETVAEIRYRDGDYPGGIKILASGGREHRLARELERDAVEATGQHAVVVVALPGGGPEAEAFVAVGVEVGAHDPLRAGGDGRDVDMGRF